MAQFSMSMILFSAGHESDKFMYKNESTIDKLYRRD